METNMIASVLFLLTICTTGNGQENAMDIVFALDGSARVSLTEFVREKNVVISLLNRFNIGKENTNVGIVVYSSNIGDEISLKPFKGKELLVSLTTELRKLDGGFNTHIGIKSAHQMLMNAGRSYAKKVIVLITKGRSERPTLAIQEANLAKEDRIIIMVVGVGKNQPEEFEHEIRNMSSNSNTMIRVNDFKELSSSIENAINIIGDIRQDFICQGFSEYVQCPYFRTINVINADYGRTSKAVCIYPWLEHSEYNNTSCFSKTSDSIVKDYCNGKTQCLLSAVNSVFNNPCVGTYKYLRVIYQCISDLRMRSRSLILSTLSK